MDPFYAVVRVIARFWIWFFFERVEVRHPERVPPIGPVLPRKVHYLATAALFRNPLIARFLVALGVIPVYRKADDPDKMDRNMETFAACDQAWDGGQLIAIYPEGATHAEAHVQRIKTGAARIALGYEARGPRAPHRRAGRTQFRGPQEVPGTRPRLLRGAGRRLVVPGRLSRGTGEGAAHAHELERAKRDYLRGAKGPSI